MKTLNAKLYVTLILIALITLIALVAATPYQDGGEGGDDAEAESGGIGDALGSAYDYVTDNVVVGGIAGTVLLILIVEGVQYIGLVDKEKGHLPATVILSGLFVGGLWTLGQAYPPALVYINWGVTGFTFALLGPFAYRAYRSISGLISPLDKNP